ncbi:hypothetical protein HU200_044076 [Digitaria exilis]|uniref:Uncharacterized protein n=1 Tax=Digitaria exilis TaxID=1010633 RepID=A0A835AZJ8_9POAL|nr:hypothetical protein HU200_044076 [Digitaria exilis]
MEFFTGALPSLLPKLAALATGEYNLQKGLKGEIKFLHAELESVQGALEDISKVPTDQLPSGDKIWARSMRELSYDMEDSIDKFMMRCNKGGDADLDKQHKHGSKNAIGRCLDFLMQPMIRRKIATEIRGVKNHVIELHQLRMRYKIDSAPTSAIADVDPRLYAQSPETAELVGIDEARDELVNALTDRNDEVSMQQGKIVFIVGFGGLGKTTLANAVYGKIRGQFDYSAFIAVSQTPDMKNLFKSILYQLRKTESINQDILDEWQLISELKEFLQNKRSIIVIDDIWNISHWEMIKRALPDNHGGYRIITTSHILDIAKQVGGTYMMKPLSPSNSRILLCSRILGDKDQESYLDKDLAKVSDKVKKKCVGVPLAIITVPSLLASKGRYVIDWYKLYNSIGTGLENSLDRDNMRKILLLSYYDLPSHLKTCLLYLSIFPEDFKIEKGRLIWMWAAEGFIQCKRQGESLLELGESYFNELRNRSMIQLVNDEYCRVDDMVLDLICYISSEENFVTILNDTMDHVSPSNTVRRLSLHDCPSRIQDNISKKRIRSVVVFSSGNDPKLDLGSFRVLRVLDLQHCNLSNVHSLKYLGKLIHLRYLGLGLTRVKQLPEEIGNLRFLQTLDTSYSKIYKFPQTVFQLKHLRCLHIHVPEVPKGICNLTSLEVLTLMWICNSATIIEPGHLTELRVLKIELRRGCTDDLQKSLAESLVDCLQKLKKIQIVDIKALVDYEGPLDAWHAPRSLRKIKVRSNSWFSTRPDWMNPSHLQHLSILDVYMKELQQEDLEILGRLPALHDLCLSVEYKKLKICPGLVVGASSFPCLVRCQLGFFVPPVVFWHGAMPRLTDLMFTFSVCKMREITGSISGFELGLANLTSLRSIEVRFPYDSDSKEDKQEAMAVLRHEAEIHPNRPRIWRIF